MNFGDNLKKLRKLKKLSQEDLAEKVGVSRQSVSKWETGDAYPEMNNILELCKILHCNINDLVNDSIIDLESLDEEVKKKAVKLKKEQQKIMKGLSEAIIVISKICKVVLTICIPIFVIAMLIAPFLINSINVKNDELIFKGSNKKIELITENSNVILKYNGNEIDDKDFTNIVIKYKEMLDTHSKPLLIGYAEVSIILLIVSLILCIRMLKHLEELFTNIKKGDTPFTLVNINHIRKMAYLMIATIILPHISEVIFDLTTMADVDVEFKIFDIIEALFLFSMIYIFEYGYELQLESNGRMYGEENE